LIAISISWSSTKAHSTIMDIAAVLLKIIKI